MCVSPPLYPMCCQKHIYIVANHSGPLMCINPFNICIIWRKYSSGLWPFLQEHLIPGLKCFAEEDSCSLKRFWGFIGQLLSLQFHISLKKCVHNSMMTRAVQELIRSTLLFWQDAKRGDAANIIMDVHILCPGRQYIWEYWNNKCNLRCNLFCNKCTANDKYRGNPKGY